MFKAKRNGLALNACKCTRVTKRISKAVKLRIQLISLFVPYGLEEKHDYGETGHQDKPFLQTVTCRTTLYGQLIVSLNDVTKTELRLFIFPNN